MPSYLESAAQAARRSHLLRETTSKYGENGPDKVAAIRDAVQVMDGLGVLYALIGGLAVGIRSGVPRATLDVDFAVPSKTDLNRLSEALEARGFSLVGRFEHSLNFRHASGEPVQFAFDPSFDAMIARAELLDQGSVSLRVVTKEDLIAMKERAAADPECRPSKALRDKADVALLREGAPDPDEGW